MSVESSTGPAKALLIPKGRTAIDKSSATPKANDFNWYIN
jgi:hypothetical protein